LEGPADNRPASVLPLLHSSTRRGGRLSTVRLRLALALAATLLALLAAEIVLRLFPTPFIYASMRSVVQQDCTRPHPVLQYVNRENYVGEFANREFHTTVRINPKGLRDRDLPYDKPAGQLRCLALGDSFAFGWGVEAEESVAKRMEGQMPGVEVINGACPGWNTLQELGFLEEEGIRYRPDVVQLFFCENDPGGNLARYKFVDGRLRDAEEPEGRGADFRRWLIRHSAVWNLLRSAVDRARGHAGAGERESLEHPEYWDAEEGYLEAMQSFCQARGARFAIVFVPNKGRGGGPASGQWLPRLASFCAARRVPLLDLTPALAAAARQQPVYFRLDDHWNRRGHQVAAEAAAAFLRQQGWAAAPR
jgi:hypothetical protein